MSSTAIATQPRVATTPRITLVALATLEGRRMLRHPGPWAGLVLSAWWAWETSERSYSGALYTGLVPSLSPIFLGISLASVSAFGRDLVPLAEEAPVAVPRRSVARLLGGLSLVAFVAVIVTAGAVWLRTRGGLDLGDEPGRTLHAHYSLPELLQPVLLACFAVTFGAAVVTIVRQRLVASILLAATWLVLSTYWLFSASVARWLTPLQVQPVYVEIAPAHTDPTSFPADWLLSAPGPYQDHWARVVVSPALAAWHGAYLLGLVALFVAVVIPGLLRRYLAAAGLLLVVAAVIMQSVVAP